MLPQQIQCLGEILTLKEIHDEYVFPFAIYVNEMGEEGIAWLSDDCKTIIQVD
jgi:hypothetical protein